MFGALGCLALVHCNDSSSSCDSTVFVPPIIVVSDADTGAAVCDARVVANGPLGPYSTTYTLSLNTGPGADAGSCWYDGPAIAGSFDITASKDGFASQTVSGLMPKYQACDAPGTFYPQVVRVALLPN